MDPFVHLSTDRAGTSPLKTRMGMRLATLSLVTSFGLFAGALGCNNGGTPPDLNKMPSPEENKGIDGAPNNPSNTSNNPGTTEDNNPNGGIPNLDETNTMPKNQEPPNPACKGIRNCYPIDLLFVIDNSGTMGEEQQNLARNFEGLLRELLKLTDSDGKPVPPSINLMVTTTDVSHPLCAQSQPEGYKPAMGRPVATACRERLNDFRSRKIPNTPEVDQSVACTNTCKEGDVGAVPSPQAFIHFGPEGKHSNVPNDAIFQAINCIGPQGINGCGYEAPLEAMHRALDPAAPWNQGDHPFLRKGANLAVAIVTDEADCSVRSFKDSSGFPFFLSDNTYWEVDPLTNRKEVSSAACWNSAVECTGESNGVFKECHSKDNGVLFPVSRYVDKLRSFVQADKEVIMLGILGVPEVTKHADKPPFQPIEGGVHSLQYRNWLPSDILPGGKGNQATPAGKRWEFGIGPGCTRAATGQAVPPVRVKEVCESLNRKDDKGKDLVRCCIESICDDDFSNAMRCLSGLIQILPPPK